MPDFQVSGSRQRSPPEFATIAFGDCRVGPYLLLPRVRLSHEARRLWGFDRDEIPPLGCGSKPGAISRTGHGEYGMLVGDVVAVVVFGWGGDKARGRHANE